MKVNKKEILKKFKAKGFQLDSKVEEDFYTDFRFFINKMIEDETMLLEELYRIYEKKEKGEELTALEQKFYSYLSSKFDL